MTRKSNNQKQTKSPNKLRAALLAIAFAASLAPWTSSPASAADRVFQVPGKCGALADFQYVGNGKKGRSQLISFGPEGEAGFVLEGVEGLKVSQLKEIVVDFTPPQTAGTGEFLMLVKFNRQPTRIQRFSLGANDRPKLPNIPTTRFGAGLQVEITPSDLVGGNSKLGPDDVIEKIAFVFSATKLGPKISMFVDGVVYDDFPAPLVLENVTCNLK